VHVFAMYDIKINKMKTLNELLDVKNNTPKEPP